MTVIVALKAKDRVYMGCDSIFLDPQSFQTTKRTQSKLIIKEELVIGITTIGCRIFQVMKFKLKLPSTKKIKTEDLLEYMSTVFCSKVFKLLKLESMLVEDSDRKNSDPCLSPAIFLIGIRDRIFEVGEDFDVAEIDMPFFSVGNGGDYATGSLEATTNLNTQLDPEHHLIYALKTASKFSAAVGSPYQIVNTLDLDFLECS